MLEKLLGLVKSGECRSLDELAKRLDVSEALALQMLERLEQMGYLKRLENCSDQAPLRGQAPIRGQAPMRGQACAGCPHAKGCSPGGSARQVWMLVPANKFAATTAKPPSGG